MAETPPTNGAKRQILRPHEKQQQAKDRFNVDSDEEQRVDVECHWMASFTVPLLGITPPIATNNLTAEKN
jgi:hypothetical protein